ncbi:MAG: hypothetical protein DWH97_12040 [Planctomycetota bacterium]|nr:MAG: hypothetical protein DWH97_12040 [Planctomycetota bacterium]RLS95315.1 MAG: hypothetical protein DWI12_04440 [Planctomycetota bacterium]
MIVTGGEDNDADGALDSCKRGRGDFALDGKVSAPDLAELLSRWGFPNLPYGDINGNGILDICESGLAAYPADFDQNGEVGATDLAQIFNPWGPAPGLPRLDPVPDGIINGADLAVLLNAWGTCAE